MIFFSALTWSDRTHWMRRRIVLENGITVAGEGGGGCNILFSELVIHLSTYISLLVAVM